MCFDKWAYQQPGPSQHKTHCTTHSVRQQQQADANRENGGK